MSVPSQPTIIPFNPISSTYEESTNEQLRRLRENPGALNRGELFWRHHGPWLKEKGYALRPRYQKNWEPSWHTSGKYHSSAEDGQRYTFYSFMDATRVSDGTTVFFKREAPEDSPHELSIHQYLTSEALLSEPRNHTVPLLEVLDMPEDAGKVLVMPFMRPWYNPPFTAVGEAVSFFEQIFEGLQFMHEHHVAHRDCTYNNIVFDATSMYPKGYHPADLKRSVNWKGHAKHFTRTRRPVRYYYIDFGHSRRYDPKDGPPSELPLHGGDRTAPEHREELYDTPCNPFQTDIYYLGNLIREEFLQKLIGFEFMIPLVADMVKDDPSQRPTIDEVVSRFQGIVKSLPWWKLRERVARRKDFMLVRMFKAVPYVFRVTRDVVTRTPAIPRPSS